MSLPASWAGLFEIEAIDPYPYHGLAYSEAQLRWLQPSGARPRIPFPSIAPAPSPAPSFQPLGDAAVWDVGRPDPPFSEQLYAAGGESLGRRLVPVHDGLTMTSSGPRHLVIRDTGVGSLILREETRNGIIIETLDTVAVPETSMLAGVTEMINPYNGATIPAPSFISPIQADRSRDGCTRVLVYRSSYSSPSRGIVGFISSILMATIKEDPTGGLSLDLKVAANLLDCIGVTTYTRDSEMYWYQPSEPHDPIDPMAQVWSGTQGTAWIAAGRFGEDYELSGVIVGAWLEGDVLKFIKTNLRHQARYTCDPSGSSIRNVDGSAIWRWVATRTEEVDHSAVLFLESGSSVAVRFTSNTQNTLDMTRDGVTPGAPQYFVGELSVDSNGSMTGLPDFEEGREESVNPNDPASISPLSALQACGLTAPAGWAPEGAIAPREIEIGEESIRNAFYATAELADTRCSKTAGFLIRERVGSLYLPRRVSGTLTPDGVYGEVTDSLGGTYPAAAYYNPLTGETARVADHPEKSILGWI